jgi:chorismate lyase/3-hydroxybenzoate synthase
MILFGACLHGAVEFTQAHLRREVSRSYGRIRESMARTDARYPVRFWGFLPGIHEVLDGGLSRYLAFNSGRHDAYCEWFGGAGQFAQHVPASTAVGHSGEDLFLYCLAAARPGHPTENPRQRPAFRYSTKYGPRPPCFTRATVAPGDGTVFVSGTASVRGEDSVHVLSLEGQLEETFVNLAAVASRACESSGLPGPTVDPASLFTELRAYYLRRGDEDRIRSAVTARFENVRRVEMMQADLCREELLVEIEGVARLDGLAASGPFTPSDDLPDGR